MATPAQTAELERAVWAALDSVFDPELDEPITHLGFVRSVTVDGSRVNVHLRLPTSFCSPNFAYLMASDAKDVLTPLASRVEVVLEDHHDSEMINSGLAVNAGYRGTFGVEADSDLDELRHTFRRKAHTAAMERVLTALLRRRTELAETDLHAVTLGDLPDEPATRALHNRRAGLGLSTDPGQPVLVDDEGRAYPPEEIPLRLRFARATRISLDGNAHFCRGLLRTRYPASATDQSPRPTGDIDTLNVEETA